MNQKICLKCNSQKHLNAFQKDRSRKDGLTAYCKDCKKIYDHNRYKTNPYPARERARKVEAIKNKIIKEWKNVPCKDCNKTYPSCAMEFDHVHGHKLGIVRAQNLRTIIDEANKCEIVCVLCHRTRTAQRKLEASRIPRKNSTQCKKCGRYLKMQRSLICQNCAPGLHAKRKEMIAIAKKRPCIDCGQTFPSHQMDLDHIKKDKKDRCANLVSKRVSLKELAEEISKCEAVCAICHRLRTSNRNKTLSHS